MAAAVEAGLVAVASGRRGCGGARLLLRGLYWRLRALLRRLRSDSERARRGRRFSYHYDALSYALNFDDGRAADLVLGPGQARR
ncbi:hypothetical protein U9M48_022661 [Paspalum notatum var. saurae]|uniref:Uncharacterized protein n=1 Tax=Paspalum notatum var. saurae TaxID=547442 RepID=A0AAQ3TLF9_PASNO